MTRGGGSEDELTPAEQRVVALLAPLRAEPVPGDGPFVGAVIRTVRWQRTVREVALAIAGLAASVSDGVALVLGVPRRSGGPRR